MMQGLVGAMRAIIFATLLLAAVLTLWGIVAVETVQPANILLFDEGVYGDCAREICRDAFSSVLRSVFTFLKTIVAGDSWGQLAIPLLIYYPGTCVVILGSLFSVQLGLLNLIVAIIVEGAAQARLEDDDLIDTMRQEEFVRSMQRLMKVFDSIDLDNSGTLTKDEILLAYEVNADFFAILQSMDINTDDIALVFEVMDSDGSGEVNYKEFVEQLHMLQNFNSHTLLYFVRHHVEVLRSMVGKQSDAIEDLMGRLRPGETSLDGTRCMESARRDFGHQLSAARLLGREFVLLAARDLPMPPHEGNQKRARNSTRARLYRPRPLPMGSRAHLQALPQAPDGSRHGS